MSIDLTNATTTIPSARFELVSTDGTQSVSLNTFSGTSTLSIVKDKLTTPNGIGLDATGIAYDNGTTTSSTTWDNITNRIASLSAIAPNGLNATVLAINDTISIQNADSSPTRVINTSAQDNSVGAHFGIEWVGDTLPFVMETLDSTPLEVKDTTFQLNNSSTPLLTTMTASTLTSGASSKSWADIIAGSGSVGTLNSVLTNGNTATGTHATITLTDPDVGGQANPILTLNNTNATGSVAMEVYKNKPTAVANGDVLFNQSVYGKDSALNKQEYTRISHTIRDGTGGVEDGSIEFGAFVNGSFNNFLQINGNENEVNCLKVLDMGGNSIRTNAGNLTIETTASSGTGTIALTPKTGAVVDIQGDATLTGTRQATFGGGTNITNIINRTGLLINNVNTQSIYQDANCNLVETDTPNDSLFTNTNFPQSQTIRRLAISSGNDIQKNQSTLVQTRLDYTDTPTGDTSSIRLENDLASLNNVIGANFTTGAGAVLETIIQTTPYGNHRLSMTNNNSGFSTILSTTQLQINDTTTNKSITIDNNSSGHNRIDLFKNDGSGISSTTGAVNTTSTQTLFLNHVDNANNKSISIENNRSIASAISFNNTIDGNGFDINSNKSLNLISTDTGGTTQLQSANGVQITGENTINLLTNTGSNTITFQTGALNFNGAGLQSNSSGGNSGEHLVITLNGTQYKIALQNP